MSSDSEIDDLQKFEDAQQRRLASKAGLSREQAHDDSASDEEVLGIESDNDGQSDDDQYGYYEQDDNTVKERREAVGRRIDDNWGSTRDNYFGGEDDIGADEGASEEEEEEALRLQQKELEEMSESDFFDEEDMEGWKKEADKLDLDAPTEVQQVDPSTMTAEERRELVAEKFPAVLLLSKELSNLEEWESQMKTESNDEIRKIGLTAISTYRGMIYSFFALFEDRLQKGDFAGLSSLEEHPVNEGLLMARQLCLNCRQIKAAPAEAEEGLADKHALTVTDSAKSDPIQADADSSLDSKSESGEDAGSDVSMATDMSDFSPDEGEDEDADEFSIAKPQRSLKSNRKQVVDDFDEAADTIEQQARARNKQSLRFYTSQIGKEDRQRQQSYSGDVDLPYREREFERRQRLMAEAQKRGKEQKDKLGADFDDFDDDSHVGTNGDDADRYAALKNQRDASREEKKQRNAEAVKAARAGRIAEYLAENPDVDKRAINYQIEKNKGLTPKRKKENRNARVKKRLRYEAAQKKLKGVRKVYKGAEGPYQGELTGIRKNLTHSTRFKN